MARTSLCLRSRVRGFSSLAARCSPSDSAKPLVSQGGKFTFRPAFVCSTVMASAPSEARHLVNFITTNSNKLAEVKAILEPAIQVESQTIDLAEIQGTLEDVTIDKCRRAADVVRPPLQQRTARGR